MTINFLPTGYIRPVVFTCVLFAVQIATQGWTDWAGTVGGPRVRARLLNEADNSKAHVASVEVEVQHVWLHAPESPGEYGVVSALLQYRVDNNPSVVTSDSRLRFEQLPSGNHVITIVLVGADDRAISGPARLSAQIP
jgi:hypothetical protein